MNLFSPLNSLKPYIYILFLFSCFLTTLLNTNLFGPATLTAYFGFCILAIIIILMISIGFIHIKRVNELPIHLLLYLVFSSYIVSHGIYTKTFNLTHYYWIISALFLTTLKFFFDNLPFTIFHVVKKSIFRCITILVFLEALVVLAQWLKIIPTSNIFFACTGTWQNPNVTAMFLSLGLYAFLQIDQKNIVRYLLFFFITIALILLKCRTAYIISLLLIAGRFSREIQNSITQKLKQYRYILYTCMLLGIIVILYFLVFYFKLNSTNGRLHVWKGCISLIVERPLFGHGFGLFEKYYNSFISEHPSSLNDHVFMAYNDFLELGVEGGLIAIFLWLAFVITLFRYNVKNQKAIWPTVAFLLIQITNFGFQAIPVFVLFLLYTAIECQGSSRLNEHRTYFKSITLSPLIFRTINIFIFIVSACLLFHQTSIAIAFKKASKFKQNSTPANFVSKLADLNVLSGFQWYHENYGDAYLQMKQFKPALKQYRLALLSSSSPDLFSKCGFCFQQLNKYDSSKYYYSLSENMVPYMFTPRMALLLLYQQNGDKVNMTRKAAEIVSMPVRVESEQIYNMKNYAKSILVKK